ncbi:MAG: FHA domain-containing protein [Calothrix sp. MO_167.B42]|nr:FHA domain-containing protein [Calothrix sp. MO_167.B42]
MITLILLNPLQSLPPQSWTFEDKPVIHIGRSTDNDVVLYSAVVSRRHVELRKVNDNWEIVSLGANGTFLNGEQIQQIPLSDRIVLRLARSGPQIQIRLGILTLEEIRESISEHYSQAASTES